MYLAELARMASDPAPIGVVGVGRMGRGIVDQVATMRGLRVMALADIDAARALAGFTENGWDAEAVCVSDDLGTAQHALRHGRPVATADPLLVPELELRAVVESTGVPGVGAQVAGRAIARGRHPLLLNLEVARGGGPRLRA